MVLSTGVQHPVLNRCCLKHSIVDSEGRVRCSGGGGSAREWIGTGVKVGLQQWGPAVPDPALHVRILLSMLGSAVPDPTLHVRLHSLIQRLSSLHLHWQNSWYRFEKSHFRACGFPLGKVMKVSGSASSLGATEMPYSMSVAPSTYKSTVLLYHQC